MKLKAGDSLSPFSVTSLAGGAIAIPDPSVRLVHLQFRRFAGCPVCNFHLHTMARRHGEIAAAGIREVVFFHSSAEEMQAYQGRLPFDCVADPRKAHYRRLGVETSILAPLHPRVLWNGARGVLAMGRFYRRAENGIFGLPADFLIDPRGRVVAAHYGTHADDQWSVDELLRLAGQDAPQAAIHSIVTR